MIYTRIIICEPGIWQSVSQVSLKLIRDPLRLGLTPLQQLQPAARVQFGQGTSTMFLTRACRRGVKPTQAEAWAKFPRPFGPQSKRGKGVPVLA